MKMVMSAVLLVLAGVSMTVQASPACESKAAEKKLAGAAKDSFLKKCEREATAGSSCMAKADEKKLAGAARNSFVTKCEKDAKAPKA